MLDGRDCKNTDSMSLSMNKLADLPALAVTKSKNSLS
jgi:hypothetical protein